MSIMSEHVHLIPTKVWAYCISNTSAVLLGFYVRKFTELPHSEQNSHHMAYLRQAIKMSITKG